MMKLEKIFDDGMLEELIGE